LRRPCRFEPGSIRRRSRRRDLLRRKYVEGSGPELRPARRRAAGERLRPGSAPHVRRHAERGASRAAADPRGADRGARDARRGVVHPIANLRLGDSARRCRWLLQTATSNVGSAGAHAIGLARRPRPDLSPPAAGRRSPAPLRGTTTDDNACPGNSSRATAPALAHKPACLQSGRSISPSSTRWPGS